ncbi:response regulator transcription factor [Halarcobacter bivalviorum]|uniref:Two-component system response regulator n=1 Tax=Halarcobacter bivalviorum TaxID=663364 RepID=A0AB33GII2_9BACT|nr:response regulator [Halarcobacter bivalviorum]AXH12259.1 two-component system response regulator [Halarcobacter bivalviorum]
MLNTSNNYKKYTVLYVEDEKIVRSNVEVCLNYLFNVIIAENGKDGLEKFKNECVDLVITDVNMPLKDGITMLKDIKEINPNVPCIITSALDLDMIEKIKSLNVCKCISKPFDMRELLDNSMEILKLE